MAGFWQGILSNVRGGSAVFTPQVTYLGAAEFAAMANPEGMTASQMWESQPHFRTVVTFLARNIAQLGLHSFERVDQTDRRRDRESVLAQSLDDVDGQMTTFELVFALVGDLALYDRAYWWAAPSSVMPSGWMVRRLPPTWVEPVMANPFEVKEYLVYMSAGVPEVVPAEHILAFPGYHPGKMRGASPTVDALRQTLQEQVEAATYRSQVWKRGGRVSSVIERPATAPAWSDAQASRFRSDWYANFTGNGPRAGGTPVLEDGMTLKQIDFSAKDQQFVEAAKLSLTTVASAFHVNPTMIGQNDGANYSNVREFRKMLYGDTLGPLMAQIEGRINTFLVPRMGLDRRRVYVEFNIKEKLQGNFEEQAASYQAAVGGPYMTRNEARATQNLPAVDGGDELIVPLNVLVGGQASPRDGQTAGGGGDVSQLLAGDVQAPATVSGFTADEIVQLVGAAATLIRSGFAPEASLLAVGLDPVEHLGLLPVTVQRPEAAVNPDVEMEEALKLARDIGVKAGIRKSSEFEIKAPKPEEIPEEHAKATAAVFSKLFARQRRAVLSAAGAKSAQWWDADRWDEELADDLLGVSLTVSESAALAALAGMGIDRDEYNTDRTKAFLKKVSERIAGGVNGATLAALEAALADGGTEAMAHVFDVAEESRVDQSGMTAAATFVGFGMVEAARQTRPKARKRWQTNSSNPRASHAALNGEEVPIDEPFSNGLEWPGGLGAEADETAGCQCSVIIVT